MKAACHTESHPSPHPSRLRTPELHRTPLSPSAKGYVGMGMFHAWGSQSGTPGPRNHFGQKIKSSLCPLSLSCYCENRKLGFVFTRGLPWAPTEPPHCRVQPYLPAGSWPDGPPDEASCLAGPSCSWKSQVTLPQVFSLPSTQGFNSSVADGRLLSVFLVFAKVGNPIISHSALIAIFFAKFLSS